MTTPPPTTWIASYPKSGNTWVRFLLHSALFGPPERSIDINKNIPDLHRQSPDGASAEPPPPHLRKTHLRLTPQHPRLATTARAVHIVRNPRDVLRSALHFHTLNAAATPNAPAIDPAQYARLFIASRGDPLYAQQGFGTWSDHTTSWADTKDFPVLTIRYEDLKADTHATLTRILDFIGTPKDDATIAAAVQASEFDTMRALEEREKRANTNPSERLFVGSETATSRGLFFMNTAKSNQPLDTIEPGLDAALDNAFATELDRFHYTRDE